MSQNAAQAGMKKAVKDQRQSVACGGFTCLRAELRRSTPANLITVVLDEANTCVEGWIPIEQEHGSVMNASVSTGRIVPARRAVSSCQMLRHSDSAAGNAWADPPRRPVITMCRTASDVPDSVFRSFARYPVIGNHLPRTTMSCTAREQHSSNRRNFRLMLSPARLQKLHLRNRRNEIQVHQLPTHLITRRTVGSAWSNHFEHKILSV